MTASTTRPRRPSANLIVPPSRIDPSKKRLVGCKSDVYGPNGLFDQPRRLASANEPARAGELRPKPCQRHVAHALTCLRRRDRRGTRDHKLNVPAALAEQQVTGPQRAESHRPSHPELVPR